MTQQVYVGNSGNKTVTEIYVGTSSGNKTVSEGWIGTASGNKQFYAAADPLTTSLSANSASSSPGGLRAPSSGNIIVSVSGGAGGETIAWSTSNANGTSISSSNSESVYWTVASERDAFASWSYVVTDADGETSTGSVSVQFESTF